MTIHANPLEPLILDLLEWIGPDGKPYADVMDAWRTSCPRLPVWEEANDAGLVVCQRTEAVGRAVVLTPAGLRLLEGRRPAARHRRGA